MIFRAVFLAVFVSLTSASGYSYEIVAHRGASGVAPENTLAAIRAAEEQGSDYVEIDLHMTADGHVIVLHDSTVDRTSNGKGKVGEMMLADVQALDAGSWFSKEFAGARIPTLEEIFRSAGKETKLILELKSGSEKYPEIERKVVELIEQFRMSNRIVLKSFNPVILNTFEKIAPEIPRLYVLVADLGLVSVDTTLRFRKMLSIKNVDFYQVHKLFVTKALVKKVRAAGKKLIAWGVKPKDREKMVRLGVDIIEVDYPASF